MTLSRTREESCLSDLRLDRLLAGELAGDAESAARAHLAGCTDCQARRAAVEEERARFSVPPPARMRRARRRWWPAVAPLVAAAAAALLMWSAARDADPPATRTKGGHRLGFYVARDGVVTRGADGDELHPGDELGLTLTTTAPGFAVVASVDGGGAVSIYHPDGPRAAPIAAGEDQELRGSLLLDDTLGPETLHAFLCAEPVPVAEVRAAVGSGRTQIAGCRLDTLQWVVRPRAP
jgi:hypothetical protein